MNKAKKDKITGRYKEAKGRVKEVVGQAVGNKGLEHRGKIQKNVGKFQADGPDLAADRSKDS